jgi:hypothetical protein
MSAINSEFGYGNSLGSYYNKRWYTDNNYRGYTPASGPISFSDFSAKRITNPVTSGSTTLYGSQNFTIPLFNSFTVTVVGGQGGQAGQSGNYSGGAPGGQGGTTSFGNYISSAGGAGGSPILGGGSYGTPQSFTWTVTDENQNSILTHQNESVYASIGGGGGGGGGGLDYVYQCACTKYCGCGPYCVYCCETTCAWVFQDKSGGSGGAAGYITISWS